MNYSNIIASIFEHVEADNVEAATMACLRVARLSQDHLNAAIFLRELFPTKEEVGRTIYDDTRHLNEEAGKFVFNRSFERWVEIHTMDFAFPSPDGNEDKTILKVAAGDIESEIAQCQDELADSPPPAGIHPIEAVDFFFAAKKERAFIRLRLKALNTIKSRLKTRCLNYAIQIEKQLSSQDISQKFLWTVENNVNNYFKEHNNDVFLKLQKASALAATTDPEGAALLLTEVRRTIKAVADHFYPPQTEPMTCSDGKERVLGDEKYLNRLSEYLATKFQVSTAQELAAAELGLLDIYIRRLNDLASKGVHATVSPAEAKQGLVGMYMFLSTVTQHANSLP